MAQINLLGSNIASPKSPLFLRQRLDQTTPLRGFVCLQPNGGAPRAGPLLRIVNEKVVVSIDLNAEGSRRTTSSAEKWETAKRQGVVNPVTTVKSDPIYRNRLVNMLVDRVMKNGKKSLAYKIVYRALRRIQQKSTETKPLPVLRQAIRQVTPDVAVKARRVGGSSHQVPIEVGSAQGKALAIRWLLGASRKRRGRDMVLKLSSELVDAANGSGDAVRNKEETHRMAEANRAFAHIR